MVGLADIPCVGKFVDKVSEVAAAAMFRGLKYMFCYKSLVDELNSEIGKLNIEKDNMSRKVMEEKANGKDIVDHVVNWQKDVEQIQKSDKEFSPSCSCIQRLPIPNPVSRFRIGRNAEKKAKTVAELADTGKKYLSEEIAHHPPVQNMPKPDTAFEEFQSRKDVYQKLWDALVNEDSPLICGIYGMAGVGKTRMMEKFWEEAMEKKIFKEVVRVNVGNENLKEVDLQDQIAGRLKCKLESQDVESRASQLETSLKNGGKILLILDDVWTEIRLDKIIGTSFGDDSSSSKGSKILFTSREKEVCLHNKCEHLVEIKTLSPDEALDLFKKAVGPDTINDLQEESLVQNVCDECGHLPLLIHAVGKALKGKSRNLWTDAHKQLKEGKFQKIAGVNPKVYTGIKLSIDYLQNDDARSCLFLCSMFPEDANIDMKMLIQLATGSRLIPDGEVRILAMVDSLKTSSLLLYSREDDEIKVHDIIRDVARSVASTDSKYAFLHVKCNSKQFPSNASDCTGKFLRLDAETDDVHFEERKVCPDLHTLWLQCNNHPQRFSGGFFSMFEILSCLMLQNVNISVEQFSLKPLGNLGTLSLLECDMSNTDASLFPPNLKTLCICECELPLPLDVANLECLLKLEIQHVGPVLVKVDVISSLSSLEELHISNGFIYYNHQYHLEPIVMEISKLTRLKSLHFEFYEDEDNTFQGTYIFSNIERYNLFVGKPKEYGSVVRDWRVPLTRSIEFSGNNWQPWEGLMARAEEVRLLYSDVEVSSICNGHTRAFQDLKRLYIEDCHKMGHLASKSQDEIQYSSLQSPACFSKLTILDIQRCSKLKYLFCNNIAKSLVQLQQLSVKWCDSMEAIIMNEGTSDGEIINFSKLTYLDIRGCSKLKYLFCNNIAKSLVQLQQLSVKRCESMEAIIMNEGTSEGDINFSKLTDLHIYSCSKLKYLFCNNIAKSLVQLQQLLVFDCYSMEAIIMKEGTSDGEIISFSKLTNVNIFSCSKLKYLFCNNIAKSLGQLQQLTVKWCGSMEAIIMNEGTSEGTIKITDANPSAQYQPLFDRMVVNNLESIYVYACGRLRSMFSPSVASNLKHLKEMKVCSCGEMREIIEAGEQVITDDGIMFPQLTDLELKELSSLTSFWCYQSGKASTCKVPLRLPRLSSILVTDLPVLKSFFHDENFEFHMPALKVVEVSKCRLSTLFTFAMFRKFQLETLDVRNCEFLVNIVEDLRGDETCDKIITLSQLTVVELEKLPNLERFFHNVNYEFHMPALKKVIVRDCGLSNTLFTHSVFKNLKQLEELSVCECELLEGIFEDARGHETLDTSDKIITLNRVSEVHLQGLPKFESIFYGATYECYMPALKNVKIVGCGLSILFTCSVFREFRQLERLHVSYCESLERIVEEVESDETSEKNGKSITSFQLSSITLKSLPNLKSFSRTSSYVFNMPKLKNFRLIKCPQIEYFSSSKTNTSLVCVISDWCSDEGIQDLNCWKILLK